MNQQLNEVYLDVIHGELCGICCGNTPRVVDKYEDKTMWDVVEDEGCYPVGYDGNFRVMRFPHSGAAQGLKAVLPSCDLTCTKNYWPSTSIGGITQNVLSAKVLQLSNLLLISLTTASGPTKKMAKKSKRTPKPPSGRPVSTALISHPVAEAPSRLFSLSSFSPKGHFFAYVSLSVDKHRLRVYNTTTGQAIADHLVDTGRVSSLIWSPLDLDESDKTEELEPSKKRRKKTNTTGESEKTIKNKTTEVVVLGLSDGVILCFSPLRGRVVRTLSDTSSTSAVLALAVEENNGRWLIWASGADGTLRFWNVNKNAITGSWESDGRIPYTSLAIRSINEEDRTDILAASHSIRLLSKLKKAEDDSSKKLRHLTKFSGHASPIKTTKWDCSNLQTTRFISMAEMDRFLYVWDIPGSADTDGKAVASISLDSDAKSFSVSAPPEPSEQSILLTLSASGKISLYHIPQTISSPSSSTASPARLPTIQPRSNITSASKRSSVSARVIDVSFIDGEYGSIRVARLVQGVRPVFTVVVRKHLITKAFAFPEFMKNLQPYLDEAGQFIENFELEDIPETSLQETEPVSRRPFHFGIPFRILGSHSIALQVILNKRYTESSIMVGSGIEPGYEETMDEAAVRDIDGDLGVDLAELSLGQRLAALTDTNAARSSDSEGEDTSNPVKSKTTKKTTSGIDLVPANSLTRTLIQALHSSDTRLIETCLAHSNPNLIRNTVERLPSQLAIPLLNACVERLGRGARAANMKGGGAGASAQRGTTLITWIRTVLAVHTGHLMTVSSSILNITREEMLRVCITS